MCWRWLARPMIEGMGKPVPPSGPPTPTPIASNHSTQLSREHQLGIKAMRSAGGKECPLDKEARQCFPTLSVHLLSNYYVLGVVSGATRGNEGNTERGEFTMKRMKLKLEGLPCPQGLKGALAACSHGHSLL